MSYRRSIDYGTIVDRTSKGLGFYLEGIYGTEEGARKRAAELAERDGLPVIVKVREVLTSDWQPITTTNPPSEGGNEGSADR